MEPSLDELKKNALKCMKKYARSEYVSAIEKKNPSLAKALKELTVDNLEIAGSEKLTKKLSFLDEKEHPYLLTIKYKVKRKEKKVKLGYLIRKTLDRGYDDYYSYIITYKPFDVLKFLGILAIVLAVTACLIFVGSKIIA